MLLFLISCFSFVVLSKTIPLEPLPPWANDMRLLSIFFWKDFSFFPISHLIKRSFLRTLPQLPRKMALKKRSSSSKPQKTDENREMSVLDLPDLALECVLERLSPISLCRMAGVCSSLRDRCRSDHLWERHMKQKWGRIIGIAAYREWKWQIASRNDFGAFEIRKRKGLMRFLSHLFPISWVKAKIDSRCKSESALPVDSIMSWYLALETGRFWFPAQVYNRENGHVGFTLSCYDAELSYDPQTNTFQARYPPHGRRAIAIENGVSWERLRAAPVDTSPHDLHISDCLNDLRPGDHIEIQWRRNKEFPYGWWYGVVGHLESCDGSEYRCHCHTSDTIVLEFNQYMPGSRWRRASINRKDHREEGNEADGFYGGIRKLYSKDEISTWKHLWPTEILE